MQYHFINPISKHTALILIRRLLFFTITLVLWTNLSFAQNVLKGVIKDSKGLPIPSATAQIKDSRIFALADASGQFSIVAQKEPPFTLRISSVGYTSKDVELSGLPDTSLAIILNINDELSEIVVTSRRRIETAQNVPIPITVVGGALIADAGNAGQYAAVLGDPRTYGITFRYAFEP